MIANVSSSPALASSTSASSGSSGNCRRASLCSPARAALSTSGKIQYCSRNAGVCSRVMVMSPKKAPLFRLMNVLRWVAVICS